MQHISYEASFCNQLKWNRNWALRPRHDLTTLNAGAYVPLTMEGKIVVEGVLASCYASIHHE